MNKIFGFVFFAFTLVTLQNLFCQLSDPATGGGRGNIRIMFYNAENLFDVYNDSLTNDEEFLPEGDKNCTYDRFRDKIIKLYKTIVAVGETAPPEIIGLAEIENSFVLWELINKTPLEKYQYGIVHYDSPDKRGIDVGILYREDAIKGISSTALKISFSYDSIKTTRDILYFKALVNTSDTLHIFVNHWPSRLGGEKKSEPFRKQAALTLRKTIDSLLLVDPCARIIITGDFNDEPFSPSIKESLKAQKLTGSYACNGLYNLSENLLEKCDCGTYRYRSSWNMFDQIIVSGALLNNKYTLVTCEDCIHIADFDFLLTDDDKYGGKKPYRTYLGPVYKGGFSDHLPVYLDIYY